ncbi:hypothetical protein CEXT_130221 [Caerostris extrusa]|uniref:Uncharacterized protein n=1 Tax=Caerostris extrusa TaxID=172846 RepID=A0AAV4VF03_CAEEX|nr:hypothetical protein CEXT_130221 [Caerostris extrusa]
MSFPSLCFIPPHPVQRRCVFDYAHGLAPYPPRPRILVQGAEPPRRETQVKVDTQRRMWVINAFLLSTPNRNVLSQFIRLYSPSPLSEILPHPPTHTYRQLSEVYMNLKTPIRFHPPLTHSHLLMSIYLVDNIKCPLTVVAAFNPAIRQPYERQISEFTMCYREMSKPLCWTSQN